MPGICTFNVEQSWHAIDWQRAEQNVRGIQTRITKATQGGKWRRVKSLQRMLSRSFCGKAMAVRRVTENQGARTAGVDRELWSTPEAKLDAINQLERRGYTPRPLRRVYSTKSNGNQRTLGIPSMTDRAMQSMDLL